MSSESRPDRKPRVMFTMKPVSLATEPLAIESGQQRVHVSSILLRRDEARPLNPAHVVDLAENMHVLGNFQPIVTDTTGRLIAGGHRLAALQFLAESNPAMRRSMFLDRCEPNPAPAALASLAKRMADLGDAPMKGRFSDGLIQVHVEDVANNADGQRALAIELAENHLRRKINREEIAAVAERLKAAGYKGTSGKPKEGEKTVLGALEVALGISKRQIQRILSAKPIKKWDPLVSAQAALKRAATRAIEAAQANDSKESKAIMFAAEQVLKAVG